MFPDQRLNAPSQPPSANSTTATTGATTTGDTGGNGGSNKKDDSDDVWNYLEAQAAFLGATPASLWDNGELKVWSFRSIELEALVIVITLMLSRLILWIWKNSFWKTDCQLAATAGVTRHPLME